MKTATTINEIDRQGVEQEAGFTILANAKAFKILSDGLYSDKIRATIRELSCNGADSHMAAGIPDMPFDVQIPCRMEPDFVVRDYGVSLTHDQVMSLYTTYFESDKTHSNDFIGCLGLGSKSPFSYTDSFTVTAYLDGTKRIYTAYMDESGCPKIAQLGGEISTDEPNGLEVRFGVHPTDHGQFYNKALDVFRSFKVKPNVTCDSEFEIKPIEYLQEGTNWGIRTNEYSMSGAYVVMGNVRYPIDDMQADMSKEQNALLQQNIDIECDIGDVEVAASREKISFNDATIKNIIQRLDDIIEEIGEIVSQEFASCKNAWEVKCKASYVLNDLFSPIASLLKNNDMISFNGEKISLAPIVLPSTNKDLNSDVLSLIVFGANEDIGAGYRYRSRNTLGHSHTNTVYPTNKSKIFIQDIDRGSRIRAKSLVASNEYKRVYLVKFVDDAQKEAFIEALGMEGMDFDPISSVPSPNTKTSSGHGAPYVASDMAKVKTLVLEDNYYGRNDNRNNWEIKEIDMDAGGFYIPMSRYKAIYDGDSNNVTEFVDILKNARDIGITIDEEIVGAKPVVLDKFKNNDAWVNVLDYLKEKVIAKAKTITQDMYNRKEVFDETDSDILSIFQYIEKNAKLNAELNKDNCFWDLYETYKSGEKYSKLIQNTTVALRNFGEQISSHIQKDKSTKASLPSYKKVVKRYPMFDHIRFYSWDKDALKNLSKAAVEYVNAIEQDKGNTQKKIDVVA